MRRVPVTLVILLVAAAVLAAILAVPLPGWPAVVTPIVPFLPTAAPSPTPTLTAAQHEAASLALLDQGRRKQADGDYEQAVVALSEIVARHPSTTSTAEARFRLGESYAFLDEHKLAVDAFQSLIKLHPQSPLTVTATFLAGSSARVAGDNKTAIGLFESHAALRPETSGYVALRLGDAYEATGELTASLRSYQRAAGSGLPPSATVDALERAAGLQTRTRDFTGAIASYQAILDIAKVPAYRAAVMQRQAKVYEAAGQPRQAAALYAKVVRDYAETGNAAASLKALDALGAAGGQAPVDRYQRGLVNFHADDYPAAIAAWRAYVETAPKGDGTAWARYYIGLSLQWEGEYKAAITEFDTLISRYQTGSAVAEARLARARCLRYLGNESAAAAEYLATAKAFPRTAQSQRGFWEAGISYYRTGDKASALAAWDGQLAAAPSAEDRVRALFWSGKTLQLMGRAEEGQRRLTEAAAQNPPGHYALRAADLLGTPALAVTTTASIGGDPAAERSAVEAWVASWAPSDPPRGGAAGRLAAEPHFVRGQILAAMHLGGESAEEFRLAQEALARDPWALLEMAYLLRAQGQNHYAVTAAAGVLDAGPAKWAGASPAAFQRLLYPLDYTGLLREAATRRGVDPLTLASLIRQESLFFAGATSSAEARGLTQVIPSTGQAIADALGVKDFRPQDLYRPRLSLDFGAYYLGEMLRMTKGDVSMALASYNGGYGNAVRWAGGETPIDPDLFLENVTYSETQSYLEAVIRNIRFYKALYTPVP